MWTNFEVHCKTRSTLFYGQILTLHPLFQDGGSIAQLVFFLLGTTLLFPCAMLGSTLFLIVMVTLSQFFPHTFILYFSTVLTVLLLFVLVRQKQNVIF